MVVDRIKLEKEILFICDVINFLFCIKFVFWLFNKYCDWFDIDIWCLLGIFLLVKFL